MTCNATVHSGEAKVRLYNETDDTAVSDSELTLSDTDQLNAIEEISVEADKVYVMQYQMTSAGQVSIWGAQIRQSLS